MNINLIQSLCENRKIKWSIHALKRMRERSISYNDYTNCIMTGEIIEEYPHDRPHPSCLISGYSIAGKALHDVLGADDNYIYAITAYYPNLFDWEKDYKTRRR